MKDFFLFTLISILYLLPPCFGEMAKANITTVDRTHYIHSIAHGCIEYIRAYQRLGIGINMRDFMGNTALMVAADFNQIEVVDFFIALNVNINETNPSGETALMLAAARGYTDIAKLLIQEGADPSLINKKKKRAEDYAMTSGHTELRNYLRAARLKQR